MQVKSAVTASEDLTAYLSNFCQTLDEIGKGKKAYSLQLKDISLFKSIKYKIENYPVINELYARIDTSRKRQHGMASSHTLYRPKTSNTPSTRSIQDFSKNRLSSTDGFQTASPSELTINLQPPEPENFERNNIMYTATEMSLFVADATRQVHKLARCIKKFKIAAFSSYADASLIQRAVLQQLLPLIIGREVSLVTLGERSADKFTNKEVTEIRLPIEVNATDLANRMNEISKEGVHAINVGNRNLHIVTIIQGNQRIQIARNEKPNKHFEYNYLI